MASARLLMMHSQSYTTKHAPRRPVNDRTDKGGAGSRPSSTTAPARRTAQYIPYLAAACFMATTFSRLESHGVSHSAPRMKPPPGAQSSMSFLQ